ncbi:nucleotide-diphospho-sugar transferase [Schizopora paradoxa]|uniref:Nucleotide-diphospho-sugar transferase n=1 Tax=Schizopora paradoxa TaxID=27342 RepID=A0A0H2S1T8_9AGAM|nr:nucleotide-diphospho-sugar transferase [Schizopora paradoxa]
MKSWTRKLNTPTSRKVFLCLFVLFALHTLIQNFFFTTTEYLGDYNAVILYLASESRQAELNHSLTDLYHNVKTRPWPILLMYADDLDEESKRSGMVDELHESLDGDEQARREFVDRIEWVRLDDWKLPDNMPHDKAEVNPVFEYAWPGYHMMCNFFATQIFHLPRLMNVTYYMRLDTDSYIHDPLCYDPFERFHRHKLTYAFNTRTSDPSWVTYGLWDLLDDYARAHPEVEANLNANNWEWVENREKGKMIDKDFPTYYNNFEIVKIEAFRRPEITAWLEEIQKDPLRIYKYRWGDAPIRYATVQMFLDVEKEVEDFCGIAYYHNGERQTCSCVDD